MEGVLRQEVNPRQCLLCGSLRHYPVFNESGIDILRCDECGHIFSSFPANPHHDEFWGDEVPEDEHYYWNRARSKMHQDFFQRFLTGRSGTLLDMGCGLGFFLKAMASYTSWEAHGCEISPAAVRYARDTLGLSNINCSRLEEVNLPLSSFDIITMWDVLEHILYPDPLLKHCFKLLRDGGICFIRTPNIEIQLQRARFLKLVKNVGIGHGFAYLQARDHMHHYSESSIRMLLERNGFTSIDFMHLNPIQSTSRSKSLYVGGIKSVWFKIVRALAAITRGRLNLDNLFVVAFKKNEYEDKDYKTELTQKL